MLFFIQKPVGFVPNPLSLLPRSSAFIQLRLPSRECQVLCIDLYTENMELSACRQGHFYVNMSPWRDICIIIGVVGMDSLLRTSLTIHSLVPIKGPPGRRYAQYNLYNKWNVVLAMKRASR